MSTARSSAHPPLAANDTTGVPTAGPEPSAAARTTTPAASQPGTVPLSPSGRAAMTSP
nr:hypothetical protein [Streptomyces marincola]